MTDRARNLRALDRLGSLGNRSLNNPFLQRSFDLFFGPLGIGAQTVEFGLVASACGSYTPLYIQGIRFDLARVIASKTYTGLFAPVIAANGLIEVALVPGPSFSLRLRPGSEKDLMVPDAAKALEEGIEGRLNRQLGLADEYFRGFIIAAVGALGASDGSEELQDLFLRSPEAFAEQFASELASYV
jgi:hypothetical protein